MLPSKSSVEFHGSRSRAPVHIGIIPDGSRRWAGKTGVPLSTGYEHAMHRLSELVRQLFLCGAKSLSIYMCSAQNFRRAPDEVAAFADAEAMACRVLLPLLAKEFNAKVIVAGNRALLPNNLAASLEFLESTFPAGERRLYLCAAYDPFEEIETAIRRRGDGTDCLANYLEVPEPLDLVIRTGGAAVFSNFLPLQAGFARLYVTPKLFSDLDARDVEELLADFAGVTRLYGE